MDSRISVKEKKTKSHKRSKNKKSDDNAQLPINSSTKDLLKRMEVLKQETIDPKTAYSTIAAIRATLETSSLGLGVTKNLSNVYSLVGTMTVEGICTLLAIIILATESANITSAQCSGIAQKANGRFLGEYSTYLLFRLAFILFSLTGIGIFAFVIPTQLKVQNDTQTSNSSSSFGVAAMMGIFFFSCNYVGSLVLNKRYKSGKTAGKKPEAQVEEVDEDMPDEPANTVDKGLTV